MQGPMCRWRVTATGDRNLQGFVRGQMRWASSSSRHAGENRRVRLIGQNEKDVLTETCERSVESAREAAG